MEVFKRNRFGRYLDETIAGLGIEGLEFAIEGFEFGLQMEVFQRDSQRI